MKVSADLVLGRALAAQHASSAVQRQGGPRPWQVGWSGPDCCLLIRCLGSAWPYRIVLSSPIADCSRLS